MDGTARWLLTNPITTTKLLRVSVNCKLAQIKNHISRMSTIRVICHREHSVPTVVSQRTIYQLEVYNPSTTTEQQQPMTTPQHGGNK